MVFYTNDIWFDSIRFTNYSVYRSHNSFNCSNAKTECVLCAFGRSSRIASTNSKNRENRINELNNSLQDIENELDAKAVILSDQEAFINDLREKVKLEGEQEREALLSDIDKQKEEILKNATAEAEEIVKNSTKDIAEIVEKVTDYQNNIVSLTEEHESLTKEVERYKRQARKFKSDLLGLKNFDERFPHTINFELVNSRLEQMEKELEEERLLGTVVRLHLHSDNSKELKKASKCNKQGNTGCLREI